jgi:alkylhydroperoxidase family enzyme
LGAAQEQIEALSRGDLAPFPAETRAALELAEAMRDGGRAVTDAQADAVRNAYGDVGLLEVVAVAGLFHDFNRFNNALAVEVTR